ncbi:MAG TPA: NAD(P)/FAD-dependent oxidoreductase, partial [Deltaproteobacteria bacterium]|nr:NAD(P)/FAD-dependent oxidoreductase [Deltaproteobacteria bacterium]
TLPTSREGLIDELARLFPKERDAIARFMELVYRYCMEMVQGLFFHDPDISKEKYPTYFAYAFRNSQEVLDEYLESPLLKSILSVYWGYIGVPPSMLPFGDLAIMLWAYIEFKPYHLKGGSQAMSNALLDAFLAAGGEVRFNCAAKKIVVEGGAIKGVITEQGDRVDTGHVVSNASTIHTYIDLIDRGEIPAAELDAFKSHTIGPSAFTLYMGLDCEPEEVGIYETTNFITTTVDSDRAFSLWRTMEQQGWALLTCYDVSDPDFSPPGTCQAALVALQYGDPWYAVSPQEYADAKYRYAEGMLRLAERVFPKIRDHIEELEAATPLTHLRYLGHPGGAIYGFDQFAKDSQYFLSNRSAIGGLYFAGAWVGGGGFQPTLTSGRSTARSVLKSLKKA